MIIDAKKKIRNSLKIPLPLTIREFKAYRNGPKVLINSMPKSGTFLLRRLLFLLPYFVPRWAYHGVVAETPNLQRKILNIHKGQYVSGHLYWDQDLVELFEAANIHSLFIIRDLRDVVVSLSNYLTYKNKNHRLHPYFKQLKSENERLMTAILGIDGNSIQNGKREESIGEHAMLFAPWLTEKRCLAVRFENLIGAEGGGCNEKQLSTIRNITDYLGLSLSEDELLTISNKIFFQSSTTFRKGQIGDWENHFTDDHKEAFKSVAGEALIKLGYERNYDW